MRKTKKEIQAKFKKLHPEAGAKAAKKYRQNNPEKVKMIGKKYREKYYTDPSYRLTVLNRSRILAALKDANKAQSTKELLGCSIEEFKNHIEKKFQSGMSWENQGEWHLDHIIPCSKFNLEDEAEQKACFHYTNLQPLWGRDNIKKSNSVKIELLKKANGNLVRTEAEKIVMIKNAAHHYGLFLGALGLDWRADEQSKDTPIRVAKAWIRDLISGSVSELDESKTFPNDEGYTGLICQTNIPLVSICEHHHLPFTGFAHIAYIPGKDKTARVLGLSKLNRIAEWYARRPNIQESLTKQIHDHVDRLCVGNRGVAVVIEAQHSCVSCRGVKHNSNMKTSQLSGYFWKNEVGTRTEFFSLIHNSRMG